MLAASTRRTPHKAPQGNAYALLRYAATPEIHLRRANLNPDRSWFASRVAFTKPPAKPAVAPTPAAGKGKAAPSGGRGALASSNGGLLKIFMESELFMRGGPGPQRPSLGNRPKDKGDDPYIFGL